MPANLGNSAVAIGLEKVSFPSNPKESEVKSLSHVRLFATPWTVTYQTPLPWDSPEKNTEWLPFPSPGDLPNPEIEPGLPALQADGLLREPQGKQCQRMLKLPHNCIHLTC